MSRSIFYYKQLTATEVGSKGTHEIYVRLPNDFDHRSFFQSELELNDKVLEKVFIANNLTPGHEGEVVELRYVFFYNSNKEKRIPSLGDVFKKNDVKENDVVRLESRFMNGNVDFYITFIRSHEITLNPKQFYFSVENSEHEHHKAIIMKEDTSSLQQIYYGAPGTGKSHEIKRLTDGKNVIRTTFHPDSDYSTFVGAYKPTTKEITLRDLSGHIVLEGGKPVKEEKIVYEFVSQAFLQAYIKAWQSYGKAQTGETVKEQFLVIEEINRGNCAQIFGDLFQLLDRNEYGFSDYPIIADNDMKKQLSKAFADLDIPQREVINAIYKEGDIVQQVLEGDILLLPNNLFIWATMNTSDQSLFPIDSAFKRRWDWKYMPIRNADKKWSICADGRDFDWWDFIEKVNALIGSTTNSEDKKLGYFFCKTKDGRINADTFVGKVIFYLWNDVFKDYGFDSPQFKNADGELLTFDRFYNPDNSFNESIVARFLNNLEVNSWESPDKEDEEEYEGQNESEAAVSETDKSTWNDTEVKRYEFWKEFLDYAHQNAEFDKWFPGVKMGSKDHWKNFFIKGMDFYLVAIQQRRKNAAEVKVYFNQTNETFYRMQSHKDEIEKEMGVRYDWRELPNRKCSEISEIKLGVDYDNKDVWKELFDYFIDRLLRMREVFPKYAK